MKVLQFLLQIVLLTTVIFFGWHYFTREELHSCVSLPLASLNGKTEKIDLDQAKIDAFVAKFAGHYCRYAAIRAKLNQSTFG